MKLKGSKRGEDDDDDDYDMEEEEEGSDLITQFLRRIIQLLTIHYFTSTSQSVSSSAVSGPKY